MAEGENAVGRRWRENLRAMKERVRSRLCAASAHRSLRHTQMPAGMVALRGKTGVVARVFKGNVVFMRIADSLDKKVLMCKIGERFPNAHNWIVGVLAGSFVFGGSAHAEALTQQRTPQSFLEEFAAKRRIFKVRTAPTLDEDLKKKISDESPTIRLLRAIAVPVLGNVCHVFMHGLNRTEVHGLQKLQEAILHRPQGQGLLTVSNHVAAMDDPLVTASLLSPQMLLDERMLRWTLCATDRCFTSVSKSVLFTSLKVLPVSRGQGIHQEGMDLALEKLNRGDWVHIFPEGSRSRDGGKTLGNAKRGVGRLIVDAKKSPIIVPFIHDGMQTVLPIGSKFPHICKRVTVLVGDPIPIDDLVAKCSKGEIASEALYDAVAQRVGERMQDLKAELDQLVHNRNLEAENNHRIFLRRVSGIWEHVDWEMEGFSVHDRIEEQKKYTEKSLESTTTAAEDIPKAPTAYVDKLDWHVEGDYIGSITARLRSYRDPAAFMGFAARGLAFYDWRTTRLEYA